ncbi:MAG: hypothetical protein ACRED4_07370 [Brevundimonas sp.]
MKLMTTVAVLAALGLAACGDKPDEGKADATMSGDRVEVASGASSVDAPVAEALRCWGLTHGAAVFRLAAPDMAGNMPTVSMPQYTAWFNEALRRASAAGLNQSQFRALQNEHQMSNKFATRAELREQSIAPINACLATLPANDAEPPQLPEG